MNRKYIIFPMLALSALPALSANETNLVRIAELEGICGAPPSCNVEDQIHDPTPTNIIVKYGISRRQLVDDLIFISNKYSANETNEDNRTVRDMAICYVGQYGDTNDLPFLSVIVTNRADYAQESATMASLALLKHSPELINMVNDILTNQTCFSRGIRGWSISYLLQICEEGDAEYVDDSTQRARIASYFLNKACAGDFTDYLFVDRCACEMNPSYRHSQTRRDNLARNRPPNLTGRQAELYDARQRDAMEPGS